MEPSLLRPSGRAPEAKTHTGERRIISTFSTSLVTLGVLESPGSPSVNPSNLGSAEAMPG